MNDLVYVDHMSTTTYYQLVKFHEMKNKQTTFWIFLQDNFFKHKPLTYKEWLRVEL